MKPTHEEELAGYIAQHAYSTAAFCATHGWYGCAAEWSEAAQAAAALKEMLRVAASDTSAQMTKEAAEAERSESHD